MTAIFTIGAGYLALTAILTLGLARVLKTHGGTLLEDVFPDHPKFADAVNQLLVAGFYMVNFGYACMNLPRAYEGTTGLMYLELAARQLGGVLIVLGLVHFFNLFVLFRVRRRAQVQRGLVTVPPTQLRFAGPVHPHPDAAQAC